MKGRIKKYNKEKGYGFISAEDGKDYFFHISDVKSIVEIEMGQIVKFNETVETEKGLSAKKIEIEEREKFINFSGVSVKLSNIKEYSIGETSRYCLKLWKENPAYDGSIRAKWSVPQLIPGEDIYILEEEAYNKKNDYVYVFYFDDDEKDYIWTKGILTYKDGKMKNIKNYINCDPAGVNLIDWDRDIEIRKYKYIQIKTYTGEKHELLEYQDEENFENICNEIKELLK